MFPTQLCLRKFRIAMFKINVMLIKTDHREIWFEMWNGFSWHRRCQLLWTQNINICCSCTIKQFKWIIEYFNIIFISHQSDKCANECPVFGKKHQHKPVRVQISLQPLEAGKVSWSHDTHPCMWHSGRCRYDPTFDQCICSLWDL